MSGIIRADTGIRHSLNECVVSVLVIINWQWGQSNDMIAIDLRRLSHGKLNKIACLSRDFESMFVTLADCVEDSISTNMVEEM